jgi:hypothetical protein
MLEASFFQFITKRLNLPLWLCDPPGVALSGFAVGLSQFFVCLVAVGEMFC